MIGKSSAKIGKVIQMISPLSLEIRTCSLACSVGIVDCGARLALQIPMHGDKPIGKVERVPSQYASRIESFPTIHRPLAAA